MPYVYKSTKDAFCDNLKKSSNGDSSAGSVLAIVHAINQTFSQRGDNIVVFVELMHPQIHRSRYLTYSIPKI